MTTQPFQGYPGQIWRMAYASMSWLSAAMAAANNDPVKIASPALAVFTTLRNAVAAVTAFSTAAAWAQEITALQTVQVLPITLTPDTASYFNNRVAAYISAQLAMKALIPAINTPMISTNLASGLPAIADPDLIDFYANFSYETPPAGLTAPGLFAQYAQAEADAWRNVAAAVAALQGTRLTQAYDTAVRQAILAQQVATTIATYRSGSVATSAWNTLVAAAAMAADAALIGSAPYTNANQQSDVIRYALLTIVNKLAYLLLSLRKPAIGVTNLAALMNNDTLMDLAARQTGNFENWSGIAAKNNLLPPWTGAGGAPYGSQLFIPAPGAAPPVAGIALPTYAANVMGTDVYVGPINGAMPVWSGDYNLVTGYANLAISLGRRVQTTLGSLLYHSDFGSRIPPEVGNIQDDTTAGHIAAYGKSALQSDPRVASVLSATAMIIGDGKGSVQFNATVIPVGQSSDSVEVNQVISPLP